VLAVSEARGLKTQIHFQAEWSSHILAQECVVGEASGEDAVFVAADYFATYGHNGISITSVRITGVMRSD
jgi:hypothetical protein